MHVGNNYMIYSFFEAIHIISVIAWMAGLLYYQDYLFIIAMILLKKMKIQPTHSKLWKINFIG